MAIPSVIQGLIETEDGKVFELETPKGSAWLESIGSFRFEPSSDSKPYTVRKESGIYWYGCRKVAGKVRKKYIGKSLEVTVAKLEQIAEALEVPPAPPANQVAEVVQGVTQKVVEGAAEVAQDRLAVLEFQVANLQKAVEILQEALPGKLEPGDSLGLPKADNEVVEQLQNELSNPSNELSNLKAENEKLRTDYAALLESSTAVTNKLREEVREVRSQLEAQKTSWDELREELDDREETCAELQKENSGLKKTCSDLWVELKQKSATTGKDLPEAADLYNQLKTRRKKSSSSLADVELILEMVEEAIAK